MLVPFPLAPLHCQSFSDLRLLVDPLVSVDGSFSQQCDLFIHRTSNTINRNHNTIRQKSWWQYRTATKKPGVNRLMESHRCLVIYIFGVHSRYTHVYGNCVCVQLIFNVLLHGYMSVTRFWLKKKYEKKIKYGRLCTVACRNFINIMNIFSLIPRHYLIWKFATRHKTMNISIEVSTQMTMTFDPFETNNWPRKYKPASTHYKMKYLIFKLGPC